MNIINIIKEYLIQSNLIYLAILFLCLFIYKVFKVFINSRLYKLKSNTLRKIIIKFINITDELFSNKISDYKFESTVAGVNEEIDKLIHSRDISFISKILLKKLQHTDKLKEIIQEEFYNYKRDVLNLEVVDEKLPHLKITE